MKVRLSALVGAALLTGALATGCSSSDDSPAGESSASAVEVPGMGTAVKGDGATVTVTSAYETNSVDLYSDRGSWASGEERPTEATEARDGGKYVVVQTTVVNDTDTDMDLTCRSTGGYVDAVLQTDPKALYQPIDELRLVPGNPECNAELGSGFDDEMTWIFLVPKDRTAVSFNFLTDGSGKDDTTFIRLDKFGDRPKSTSTSPNPTTGNSAGDAAEPAADDLSGADDVTVDTAGVPDDSSAYDVPASAPAYGVPCSSSQLLQPATGADGTPLVCVGMGADAPATWVYGPEASGVGTASDGAACTEGESGGQDDEGRMMMCSQGQWVYGP